MSTWKGINHSRMTPTMERALRPVEFKVLHVVRRMIPDGQRRKLSQAEIAKRAKVSEGTVSRAMRALAEGKFIKRYFLGKGRGNGYELEVLPPREQLQLPLPAPEKTSPGDPSEESFSSGVTEPQTPPEKGSPQDRSILMSHAHEQQQRGGALEQTSETDQGAGQLAPETIEALLERGVSEKTLADIAARNPGYTPADVAAVFGDAHEKPNAHTPPGLAFWALATGQKIYVPRATADAPERPARGKLRRDDNRPMTAEEAEAYFKAAAARQAAERDAERPAPPVEPYRGEPPSSPPSSPPPPNSDPAFDPALRGSRRLGPAAERARQQRQRGRHQAGD